jgi:hypothetical protein
VSERGQGVPAYVPIGLLGFLIVFGVLISGGTSWGSTFGQVRAALREWIVGNDTIVADAATPQPVSWTRAASPIPAPATVPTIPLTISWPATPVPAPGLACAAFHLSGAIHIEDGRVAFGRFNLVSDTDPYGQDDPLAAWKLIQFDSLELDLEQANAGRSIGSSTVVTIPVDQTVNMLISDPFTQEMLFSAQWHVDEIAVQGQSASINAQLETNLSDIRTNNAVHSGTLAAFAGGTTGVLVMRFEHTEDILPVLKAGQPLYAPLSGTVHPRRCLQ